MISPGAAVSGLRAKRPFVDHLVRAFSRYLADAGDRLAASVTYYWFLSLFPILLLAISLLGYAYGDRAGDKVNEALSGILPANVTETVGDTLDQAKGPAGVLGLVGTLYTGLGWIDALRESIRSMWHQNVLAGNIVVRKLIDVLVLIGLFATIASSVLVTGFTTGATDRVLDLLGLDDTVGARVFTRLLAYLLAVVADTALFLFLFARLARVRTPLRRVLRGAVLGAVGFEVLKVLGGIYVASTTTRSQATYGTFAVVVGLLLFLNLVSRLLLFTAAWIVTAPYDSDIAPSGTSSRELARRSGIPEEFAGHDPDDPQQLRVDGAPSPLQAALKGRTPAQYEPTGRPDQASTGPVRAAGPPISADPPVGAGRALAVAHAAIGAGVVLLAGVGVQAIRALRSGLR